MLEGIGYSYNKVDKVAKEIPFALGMTIDKALDTILILKNCMTKTRKQRNNKYIKTDRRNAKTCFYSCSRSCYIKNPVDEYVPCTNIKMQSQHSLL